MAAVDAVALAKAFTHFAEREVTEDPLYQALCRHVAAQPALLALMQHAPPTQRVPNLLLAAVHERMLAGVPHALRDYFPTVGGARAPDAALPRVFDDFVAAQHAPLCALLATRRTQTNEIGRCAVLWPALCALVQRTGRTRLALLDFGCSAGLNLGVDGYRYGYGDFTLGAADDAGAAVGIERPSIECHPVGQRSRQCLQDLASHAPQLAERLGIDSAPVEVHDEAQVRWLRACLWPHDRARMERLNRAVVLARRRGIQVQHSDDCAAAIEPWLDGLPPDVLPVVFNSWVLHYFDPAARATHFHLMRELVQRRGVAWLSAEGAHIELGAAPLAEGGDARVSDAELAGGTLWWLTQREGAAGTPASTLLARSHAHGRWLQWCKRKQ